MALCYVEEPVESYAEIKARLARGGREGEISSRARWALLASVALTLGLFFGGPWTELVSRPLVWMSTLAHEMGHGLTAVLLGADFEKFVMHPDASGTAYWSGNVGRLGRALISAGGLVGPALASCVGFLLARRRRTAQFLLFFGAIVLVLSAALVVRNAFGLGYVLALAAALAGIGWFGNANVAQWSVTFFSTQLALSVFSRGDYLFTEYAQTATGRHPSDVANMASALGGPYWMWGALCGAVSVVALVLGLWLFLTGGKALRFWEKLPFGRKRKAKSS